MEIENLKANLINGISSFRIVIGILIVFVVGYLLVFGGCGKRVGGSDGLNRHAVLIVSFSDDIDSDTVRIKNALRVGGMLVCGQIDKAQNYIEIIRSIDPAFESCCAFGANGNYYTVSAVLNWVCSKGWKFHGKVGIGHDYYFVK